MLQLVSALANGNGIPAAASEQHPLRPAAEPHAPRISIGKPRASLSAASIRLMGESFLSTKYDAAFAEQIATPRPQEGAPGAASHSDAAQAEVEVAERAGEQARAKYAAAKVAMEAARAADGGAPGGNVAVAMAAAAAQEQQAVDARKAAEQEEAERKAADDAARAAARRAAAEQQAAKRRAAAEREAAGRAAAEKVAADKTAAEKAAADQATAEKAAADKAIAERAAAEKAAAEKEAADRAAAEKAAAEKAAADKAKAEKAAADKAAAEKAAADQAAADKAAADKAWADHAKAEKAAAVKAAAEKEAADQAAAEKAEADKAWADHAKAEKAAAKKAAVERRAAEEAAAEQAAADKAAADKGKAEKTAAEKNAAEQASAEQKAAETAATAQREAGNATSVSNAMVGAALNKRVDTSTAAIAAVASEPSVHMQSKREAGKCTEADPRGYLFPILTNQFNNQLVGLAENIRLAQRLGRILVLPGFVEMHPNSTSRGKKTSDGLDFFHATARHRLRPMSDIIQPQTIAPLVDFVDLRTFKSLCLQSRPVEAHAFVPEWEPRVEGGNVRRSWHEWQIPERLYQCLPEKWPAPCGSDGFDNYRSESLPELVDVKFTDVSAVAHDARTKVRLASFPDGLDVPTLITDGLLFKTHATTPPFAKSAEAVLATLGSLQWSSRMSGDVEDYVRAHFGKEPFVAIHWRRGFAGVAFTTRSVEQVADVLRNATANLERELGSQQKVTNVYIASNQINETDTARVAELMNVSGLKLHSLLLEPSLTEHMELDEISRFEQGICTRASAFVDTPKSTWSANVDAFRGKYSHAAAYSSSRRFARR